MPRGHQELWQHRTHMRGFFSRRSIGALVLSLVGMLLGVAATGCNPSFDTDGDNCSISCGDDGICPAGLNCSPHNFCTGNGSDNACVAAAIDANRSDANRSDADRAIDANHPVDGALLIDGGIPDAPPPPDAMPPPPIPHFQQMSAGTNHTCAIDNNDELYCWGDNQFGQLGFVEINNIPEPVNFGLPITRPQFLTIGAGAPPVLQVSAGVTHSCAVTKPDQNENTLFCWGDNSDKVISFMEMPAPIPPTAIPADSNGNAISWSAVAAGNEFTCGIGTIGGETAQPQVFCWGENESGQTGTATNSSPVALPTKLAFPTGATPVQIVAGNGHACARFDDDSLYCWGSNQSDQAVVGAGNSLLSPTQVKDFAGGELDFTFVAAGFDTTCAIRGPIPNNFVDCWGSNVFAGELGNYAGGSAGSNLQEVSISGGSSLTGWSALDVGRESACGIRVNNNGSNEIRCWGEDFNGSLGSPSPLSPPATNPVVVPMLPFIPAQITMGDFFGCAYDGTTGQFCWGDNHRGQTGQPITQRDPSPLDVASTSPISLTAGSDHTCASSSNLSDSTAAPVTPMVCWGLNDSGQVLQVPPAQGALNSYHVSDPTPSLRQSNSPASAFKDPTAIAAGAHHSCVASTEAGMQIVACWGANDSNQLPNAAPNSAMHYSEWNDVDSPISAMVSGDDATCAIVQRESPITVCWGTLVDGPVNLINTNNPDDGAHAAIEGLAGGNGSTHAPEFLAIAAHSVWGGLVPTAGGASAPGYFGNPQVPNASDASLSFTTFATLPTANESVGETAQGSAPHRCYATESGELVCGGLNDDGQIPGSTTVGPEVKVPLSATSTRFSELATAFTDWPDGSGPHIAVGAHHTCAVTKTGELYCWGDNSFDQLGDIDTTTSRVFIPKNVTPAGGATIVTTPQWVAVTAGARHTCAVLQLATSAGPQYQIYCWGAGDFGQLGAPEVGLEPGFQRAPTLLQ